jgi:tripartite-type tricarboxylate transporter receptor subunit TctC
VWAPARTPPAIVAKVSADVRRALESPDVRERLANLGSDPMLMSQADFAAYVREEYRVYGKVIAAAGITPQ